MMEFAPDFELPDQHGNAFKLKEALAEGAVVLFFYPKDNTYVCSQELKGFHLRKDEFADLNATVIGISSDSVSSHAGFAEQCGPQIRLLSDKGGKVRKAFGVKAHLLVIPGRETFVIAPDGRIVKRIREFGSHKVHIEGALEALMSEKK